MKLKIGPTGAVAAVYSDRLQGLPLGPMQVTRASNVEFNEKTQSWEATSAQDGSLIAAGPLRDAVIQQEVKIIESRL